MLWRSQKVALADGASLFVRECGRGPSLVFCNGFGCAGFVWEKLAPLLAKHYRLIDWNYRSHAHSSKATSLEEVSIESFAQDLLSLVDVLKLERPVVIAHSLGVQVALTAALKAPSRFSAMVAISGVAGQLLQSFHGVGLVGSAMPWFRIAASHLGKALQPIWRQLASSPAVRQLVMQLETDPERVETRDMLPYFEHLGAMELRVLTALGCSANAQNLEARLREVTVPMLVLAGRFDRTVPHPRSQRLSTLAPQGRFELLAAGHLGPLEEPVLTAKHITRFLADVAGLQGSLAAAS